MDLQERINSCKWFVEGRCPNQRLMERAYLIPQLMDPAELRSCEKLCCHALDCASQPQVRRLSDLSNLDFPPP
jgi:hypothetical protein